MGHAPPAEMLLAGPRGRRLCWLALDDQSYARTGRHQLRPLELGAPIEVVLSTLQRAVADTDLDRLATWSDEVTSLELVADSVASARYWQDPDEIDRALATRQAIEALRAVAEAIGGAPASAWWSEALALDEQVLVDADSDDAGAPRLTGAALVLAGWKRQVIEAEARLRGEDVGGAWGSPPTWSLTRQEAERWGGDRPALRSTTRSLPGLGAVGLLLEEDSSAPSSLFCRPVRCRRPPNVFEIHDADDWLFLAERHPIDVTWGRRGTWSHAAGLDGHWVLPDWALVAEEYDGVHLSLLGYLATSGRALPLDTGVATFIAGWDADATYWLTDTLVVAGEPTGWAATGKNPSRAWRLDGDHDV